MPSILRVHQRKVPFLPHEMLLCDGLLLSFPIQLRLLPVLPTCMFVVQINGLLCVTVLKSLQFAYEGTSGTSTRCSCAIALPDAYA
jgi:hypothetical protein